MCNLFKTKTPAVPPPDASLEAQKVKLAEDTATRLAESKDEDTKRQRGLVYGLFGPRSLLSATGSGVQTSGVLRPVGT